MGVNRRSFLKNASLGGLTAVCVGTDFVPTEDRLDDAGQVDAIASLRQTDPAESAWVFVEGYHEPFDGGGGLFGWKPGSSEPVDGGLVVASALDERQPGRTREGRWFRFYSGPVFDARWWGTRGTGDADDAPALQAAVDATWDQTSRSPGAGGELYLPAGRYLLESTVTVSGAVTIRGAGRFATHVVSGVREGALFALKANTGYQKIANMGFVDGQGGPNDVALSLEGRGETDSGSGNHDVELSNLFVSGIGMGIRATRSWMVNLSSVRVQHADVGISFADGFTTISMDNCFVVACRIGIRLQVDTATLTSCAVDKATQHAFWVSDGSYVFNTCHSEANRYTEPVSSVIRADGPCTLQLNGFVTVGVGPEPDRGWGSSNDDVRVFLVDCRAEDGPVHVSSFGFRQERTRGEDGAVQRLRFASSDAGHARASIVRLQSGLFDTDKQIDVTAPSGARPDIATE